MCIRDRSVILEERFEPFSKPFFKLSSKVKDPFAAPTEVSCCFFLSGINASIFSSYLSLFPDCDAKCTDGVQNPDTQMQSHSIVSIFSKELLSLLSLPIFADLTFLYPLATITP